MQVAGPSLPNSSIDFNSPMVRWKDGEKTACYDPDVYGRACRKWPHSLTTMIMNTVNRLVVQTVLVCSDVYAACQSRDDQRGVPRVKKIMDNVKCEKPKKRTKIIIGRCMSHPCVSCNQKQVHSCLCVFHPCAVKWRWSYSNDYMCTQVSITQ